MHAIEENLKIIAERVKKHAETMATEEAVKTAVVLPFLRALGYDVFNPLEVIPEFTADAVGKKGEKVDYAVCIDNEIRILFECKAVTVDLNEKHLNQLYRYFSVTSAKFAVLTNGRHFQFYTDLEATNKLDSRPFLSFDVTEYSQAILSELKKFERSSFDVNNILATAERLKYVSGIKQKLQAEAEEPSEGFVRLLCCDVYEGRLTTPVMDMLKSVTKSAFREYISDTVKSRLSNALQTTAEAEKEENPPSPAISDDGIVTTEEEIEAYMIVRAIAREIIPVNRIFMRDAKSYCAILIDDNNRRPLLRMHFNQRQKRIGFFDIEADEKVDIETLEEIYNFSDRIKATASKYVDM